MLLAAAAGAMRDLDRRSCRLWIAARHLHARKDELLALQRLLDRYHRGRRFIAYARKERRAARRLHARGRDREKRLAVVFDAVQRERGLVVQYRADVVLTEDVRGRDHCDHAGGAAHRLEIELDDLCMRLARNAERCVERSGRLGKVVDVARLAGDVQLGAIVRQGFANHAGTWKIAVAAMPPANLRSRFCAAAMRYQLEARWSESGLKSSASAAQAASRSLANAASARGARAGVAAMPPKPKRARPSASTKNAAHTPGMS